MPSLSKGLSIPAVDSSQSSGEGSNHTELLMKKKLLEVTAFVSGALVMVLEMVGSRLLAPHVGTSAVVWTSLIGVVLASLALGAWAGGRLADTARRSLIFALSGAGVGSGVAALCHAAVGQWITGAVGNLYVAAVLAALGILALPAFFFGMITPYIIRLRIDNVGTSGATVGKISALSTTGSIVGTFLGGFVLISFFGSTSILWGVAACMFLLALCQAKVSLSPSALTLPLFVAALLCIGMTCFTARRGWDEPGPDFLCESPYNSIRVFDAVDHALGGRSVRLMATDPGYCQSGMLLDAPNEPYFRYTQFYALGPYFVPQAQRILLLGGGGYSVPKWLLSHQTPLLHPDQARLTVVELDPAMTATARRWFALPDDPRLTICHEDARVFLNRQREVYDLVLVDVFNAHYAVPFHMGTREAATALRRAVAPDGMLLMNIISAVEGPEGRLFQGIFKALRTAFAEIQIFCAGNLPPDTMQNIMVAAFPKRQAESPQAVAKRHGMVDISALFATRYQGAGHFPTPPLTDDFAPVERYTLNLQRP